MVAGLTDRPVAVVGFMGAGKTTAAQAFAQASGGVAVDADSEIERRVGKPIAEIFAADGEPAFRALEHEVIAGLLGGPDRLDLVCASHASAPRGPAAPRPRAAR